MKNLYKKAIADKKDPWLALLDYRNTPTKGINSSPCQRLMSRRTRTLVPVTTNLLYPDVVDRVQESLQLRRQKAKSYFDKNAKTLPELDIGQDKWLDNERSPGNQESASRNCQTGPTWFKLTEKQSLSC